MSRMQPLKAKVVNGRYVIEEPAQEPEGTELYLVPADHEDDGFTEEEREVIRREIALSIAERKAGIPTLDAFEALTELGSRE